MTNRLLVEIYSYSILLASVIGAVRFKVILESYRPFIYAVWIALLNEICSTITISIFKNDAINNNIYTLADYIFIILLFMRWDESGYKKNFLRILLIGGILIWVTDNLILHSLRTVSSYFRIIYGVIVVFLSIEEFNKVLFTEIRHTYKNAKLIICLSFMIAYTYQAILEVFGVFSGLFSNSFYITLYVILFYINLLTNLLYALAMLWAPTKRQFTLPY